MTTYTLYWISEDGQSDINMGSFNARQDAEDSKLSAELDLIAEAADQEQRDKITAGWWVVSQDRED